MCAQPRAKSSADTISVNPQQQNEEVSNRWPDFTDDDLLPQRDTPCKLVVDRGTKASVPDPKAQVQY